VLAAGQTGLVSSDRRRRRCCLHVRLAAVKQQALGTDMTTTAEPGAASSEHQHTPAFP